MVGGGKFENGAVTGAFTALTYAVLSNPQVRKTIWDDLRTGVKGFVWDKPRAWWSKMGDVWGSQDNLIIKASATTIGTAQQAVIPNQGPALGAGTGIDQLSSEQRELGVDHYISPNAAKTQNASWRHDFASRDDPWRHLKWVRDAWVGPGVEPGPFGQIYRAAGTVGFTSASLIEAGWGAVRP